jgi:outer membrane receptor protein involved in Fe transport
VALENVEVIGHAAPYLVEASAGATKTLTPLRDIPQTLTVLPRALLADQNVPVGRPAMKNVPA